MYLYIHSIYIYSIYIHTAYIYTRYQDSKNASRAIFQFNVMMKPSCSMVKTGGVERLKTCFLEADSKE